jgi:dolichyldiphosphatase
MLLGSFIVSEVINQAIKRTWRQPRPDGPWAAGLATSVRGSHGFGMPSAHTQTMACAAGWWAAAAVLLRGDLVRGRSARRIASLLLCLTVLVAYSRVYNWYHTVEQVCLGGALGLSLGALFRFTSPRVVTVIARGIDGACGLMA